MSNKQITTWAELMACSYCSHHQEVGELSTMNCCQNQQSPFYDPLCIERIGTQLSTEQELRGCDKFNYNGKKIPSKLLEFIPSDSILRRLPLERMVEGAPALSFPPSYISCQQMSGIFQHQCNRLYDLLEENGTLNLVDGKLGPASLSD